jgi:hypothetical protein
MVVLLELRKDGERMEEGRRKVGGIRAVIEALVANLKISLGVWQLSGILQICRVVSEVFSMASQLKLKQKLG